MKRSVQFLNRIRKPRKPVVTLTERAFMVETYRFWVETSFMNPTLGELFQYLSHVKGFDNSAVRTMGWNLADQRYIVLGTSMTIEQVVHPDRTGY